MTRIAGVEPKQARPLTRAILSHADYSGVPRTQPLAKLLL